jgi:hypothetical protein
VRETALKEDVMTSVASAHGPAGNARLEQLAAAFPTLPQSAILKADVFREGVAWTPDLNVIGQWAIPHTHMIFDWDHDHSGAREDTAEGWVLIPCVFQLADGTATILKLDPASPYSIHILEGDARYELRRDGEPVAEVYFESRPQWYTRRTADGSLMCKVASNAGRNCIFAITLLGHCQYFGEDEQCAFCCIVPSTSRARDLGIDRASRVKAERMLEVYGAASAEHRVAHFNLTGGGLLDRHREARLYADFLDAAMDGLGEANAQPWHVITQAFDEDDQKRLRDAGRGRITLCHPLEAWEERLFPIIAPGKARHVGYRAWVDAVLRAGKLFGPDATTTIVAGCEMVPEEGFRTVAEAVRSIERYMTFFLEHGLTPRFTFWTPAPGSPWEHSPRPPTEYFLEISQAQHELYRRHDVKLPRSTCHKCRVVSLEADLYRLGGVGS